MAVTAFAQKAGQDTAQRGRMALGMTMPWQSSTKSYGGVVRGGAAIAVTAGTMAVTVQPFRAHVAEYANGQGGYNVVSTAVESVTLPNGGPSLPTLYNIGILVRDTAFDSSGQQDAIVTYWLVSSPPAGAKLVLAQVSVPANKTAGNGGLVSANVLAAIPELPTLGGAWRRKSTDAALTANSGRLIYQTDKDRLVVENESGGQTVLSYGASPQTNGWNAFTPTFAAPSGVTISTATDLPADIPASWSYKIHGGGDLVTLMGSFKVSSSWALPATGKATLLATGIPAEAIPGRVTPGHIILMTELFTSDVHHSMTNIPTAVLGPNSGSTGGPAGIYLANSGTINPNYRYAVQMTYPL